MQAVQDSLHYNHRADCKQSIMQQSETHAGTVHRVSSTGVSMEGNQAAVTHPPLQSDPFPARKGAGKGKKRHNNLVKRAGLYPSA